MSRINHRVALLVSTAVAASLLTAVPASADPSEPRRRIMRHLPEETPPPPAPAPAPAPAPVANSVTDPEPGPEPDPDLGYGAELAVTGKGAAYALAADHGSVWKREGDGTEWTKVGGPADSVHAGRAGLFAISPYSREVYKYDGEGDSWKQVAGPSADIVVNGNNVYRTSDGDGSVHEWSKDRRSWEPIGGRAKRLFLGGAGLFATSPADGAIYKYGGKPHDWERIGGPGSAFAVDNDDLYGISPDGSAVFRWKQDKKDRTAWEKIGGPAQDLYAGGAGLYATSPADGALHKYGGRPEQWLPAGSAGAVFAVNDKHVLGLSPDRKAFFQSEGKGEGEPWKYLGGPEVELQELRDEQTLVEERGQPYVDEFRKARDLDRTSLSAWLSKEKGLKLLLDVVGVDAVVNCVSSIKDWDIDLGSLLDCLDTAAKPLGVIRALTKADEVKDAVKLASKRLPQYSKDVGQARERLNDARKILDKVKEKPEERTYKPPVPDCRINGAGWKTLLPTDPKFGNRATGIVACLDAAYVAANPGSPAHENFRPPGYTWARNTMYYHDNKSPRWWRNACHLLADQLSGPGDDLRNLATCTRAANSTPNAPNKADPGLPEHMYTFEKKVKEAVEAKQKVIYQVTPQYAGARTVPFEFRMSARGLAEDGTTGLVFDAVIPNSGYSTKFHYFFNLGLVTDQAHRPVPLAGVA
ncbi:DNA/RNA non-specific endonuclease [Streptomyces sp. NPDC056470]|uniref:DNA/RNA non-specific endonuclease n=1 Tax=Streptomyces sp. NPDC056470 TaxID=3345831 RepID=UPI003680BA04